MSKTQFIRFIYFLYYKSLCSFSSSWLWLCAVFCNLLWLYPTHYFEMDKGSVHNGTLEGDISSSAAMAKTTTISTIAVQSGKTRIVIALLHVGVFSPIWHKHRHSSHQCSSYLNLHSNVNISNFNIWFNQSVSQLFLYLYV